MRRVVFVFLALVLAGGVSAETVRRGSVEVVSVGLEGFDVRVGGKTVAPVRFSSNGAIRAGRVEKKGRHALVFGDLRCRDEKAAVFDAGDFVAVELRDHGLPPLVRFRLTLSKFDAEAWQGLFGTEKAPFHFLICSMPDAEVWHQRGWLNATPNADPFPLLLDVHVGKPQISCLWNRNWSYICPLGAHPIPMIGLWNPGRRLYVGYDFQCARATDQSERYVATAYCWKLGRDRSFIALCWPYGGKRYGKLVYPVSGDRIASRFELIVDTDLGPTDDPNERFQERLFARWREALPRVPSMSDLSFVPGSMRLGDFQGPIGLRLFGRGGEKKFYESPDTILIRGWRGHREMPIEAALRRGNTRAIERARGQLDVLLDRYAKRFTFRGEPCLFWEKPLWGAWSKRWGGRPVTTLHNSDAWYPARVLVELYRYDRARGRPDARYLEAIDRIFNWTKNFVWTRNEFGDVPSSPFAIGATLATSFLLDYYFTFKDDPERSENAREALRLARNLTWRYLPIWAMDSDRSDGDLDSAFLIEPNSGRNWAGLGCANEVHWVIDSLVQVYVHTGDARMRYYLRGIFDRWHLLYRPFYQDSIEQYRGESLTEGLGLFDGSGPGRGGRYAYGFAPPFCLAQPVGDSAMRVVAGDRAAIAFCVGGAERDIADYRTEGDGNCRFRIVARRPESFDLSFSYPYVDISRLPVHLTRGGKTFAVPEKGKTPTGPSGIWLRRPPQAPSSIYIHGVSPNDVITIGKVSGRVRPIALTTPLAFKPRSRPPRSPVEGFDILRLPAQLELKRDWSDPDSFAGLICGLRYAYGVPYWQDEFAAARAVEARAPGAKAVFVFYSPQPGDSSSSRPALVLSDGARLALSGRPALAWRGWPPLFRRKVVVDFARIPKGRKVRSILPRGTLLVAATAYRGDDALLGAIEKRLAAESRILADQLRCEGELDRLRREFASIPAGRIAILPRPEVSFALGFFSRVGLRRKVVVLSAAQLVEPGVLSPERFAILVGMSGEDWIETVRKGGDARDAIVRYLRRGGALLLVSLGVYPMYYAVDLRSGKRSRRPLLPKLGLPLRVAFKDPPEGASLVVRREPGQGIIRRVPEVFSFSPSDSRLRSVARERVSSRHRYVPILSVRDSKSGKDWGDAACFIRFGTGPAEGGAVLYVWGPLLEGPYGPAILGDALAWLAKEKGLLP